jgi:hypothetical protein
MTPEEFKAFVGRWPQDDDLERVNCPEAGKFGHTFCGRCRCGQPRFTHDTRRCDVDTREHREEANESVYMGTLPEGR